MRKPGFFLHMRKQRRRADHRLCFRNTYSTIPLLPKSENFKPLTIFCGSTARFVSDLIENPKNRFSHDTALLILYKKNFSDKRFMSKNIKCLPIEVSLFLTGFIFCISNSVSNAVHLHLIGHVILVFVKMYTSANQFESFLSHFYHMTSLLFSR